MAAAATAMNVQPLPLVARPTPQQYARIENRPTSALAANRRPSGSSDTVDDAGSSGPGAPSEGSLSTIRRTTTLEETTVQKVPATATVRAPRPQPSPIMLSAQQRRRMPRITLIEDDDNAAAAVGSVAASTNADVVVVADDRVNDGGAQLQPGSGSGPVRARRDARSAAAPETYVETTTERRVSFAEPPPPQQQQQQSGPSVSPQQAYIRALNYRSGGAIDGTSSSGNNNDYDYGDDDDGDQLVVVDGRQRSKTRYRRATSAAFSADEYAEHAMPGKLKSLLANWNTNEYIYPGSAIIMLAVFVLMILFQNVSTGLKILAVVLFVLFLVYTVYRFKKV